MFERSRVDDRKIVFLSSEIILVMVSVWLVNQKVNLHSNLQQFDAKKPILKYQYYKP